jgi:PAS domain-containing protein
MNQALGILDVVSLTAFAGALFYLFRTKPDVRSPFSAGAKAFLIASAIVYILVMLNDVSDRLGLLSFVEPYEDSIELMFMPLVLVAVYSLLVRQQLNDARATYEGLLHTGDMMIRAIESTPAGTVWIDTEGRIAFANPAARAMLDLDATRSDEETDPTDWIVRTGASTAGRSSISPDFSKLVTREPLVDVQVIVERPSGWRRRFSVNTAPTLSPAGRIEGVIASFLDKEPWRVLQENRPAGKRRGPDAPDSPHEPGTAGDDT